MSTPIVDPTAPESPPLSPSPPPAPPATPAVHSQGPLAHTILIGVVLLAAIVASHWVTRRLWPTSPPTIGAARAVITTATGDEPPEGVVPGTLLALSAAQSVAGSGEGAVRWEISPDWAATNAVHLQEGREVIIPAGVDQGAEIVVKLYVVRGDSIDVAQYQFTVDADAAARPQPKPKPGPKPKPKPQPKPQPKPGPTPKPTPPPEPAGPVDAAVRQAAAAYFADYPARYLADADKVGPTVLYNDLMDGQLARRKVLGEALGTEIDRLTAPLYDDATHFKDQAESARVYRLIAASLAAGLRDATP